MAGVGDCLDLGKSLVSANESAFRGLVPDACLEWTAEQSAANWTRNFKDDGMLKDGECLYVAEVENGRVVGLASLGDVRPLDKVDQPVDPVYAYELLVLNVDADWHRLGIGRQLVARAASELVAKDINHLLVRVLKDNPNRYFYERMGAVYLGSEPYNWDGYQTQQLIYGWTDTGKLVL
jgi:GNAT superfamily N-acetyltransferase